MVSPRSLPKLIEIVKSCKEPLSRSANFKPKLMEHICQAHKLISYPTEKPRNIAHIGGERSYVLIGSLAKLEKALMNWAMNELIQKHDFTPVVVPNILHDDIIERCGFPTISERSQVYKISADTTSSILDENDHLRVSDSNTTNSCLSGTSEFALVSIHIGDTINSEDLPKKFCALSTCYRAETSSTSAEWGLYRAHHFSKVEMVALTMPEDSAKMHQELLDIERDLFSQLGLEFRILDMPREDLGLSASKKIDIEAWMHGRNRFGELSSTSNCQDFQTSRLNIKYQKMNQIDGQLRLDTNYVHSLNGTACSSLRTLIALVEHYQTEDGFVNVPEPLIPYMNGIDRFPTKADTELLANIDLYPDEH